MNDPAYRLRYLMEHIGYPKDTIDYICSRHPTPSDSDLEHMCIINSYEYFMYPDGYLVHGLDILTDNLPR
jgi:hypothetical protein